MDDTDSAALALLHTGDGARISTLEQTARDRIGDYLRTIGITDAFRVEVTPENPHLCHCRAENPKAECKVIMGRSGFWQLLGYAYSRRSGGISVRPQDDSNVLYIEAPDFDALEAWFRQALAAEDCGMKRAGR